MSFLTAPLNFLAQIIGNSNTPTVDPASRLLATGSVSIEGTNVSGKITLVVTGLGLGAGKVLTMKFDGPPPYPNGCALSFAAGNAAFASAMGSIYAVASKTGIDLYSTMLTLATGTYVGYYQVIGY